MRIAVLLIVTVLSFGCRSTPPAEHRAPASAATESISKANVNFISDMRQLTFAGRRAGEGYFSADGRSLIFQSEREPGNPFYQMYVLDLATGRTRRVSPGMGKTSCGWLHPDGKHALFASTHADPDWRKKAEAEWEERKNPKSRYSWNFDEAYEIYQSDLNGKGLKNLTRANGYDAEASYSPDGAWIAFASNRRAYDGSMTAAERELFAKDPSYMMDLYIMRADGRDVRRLTTEPGYDGGPFFSPDGRRLTYRHFAPDGHTAEIYTMNVDGSDKKALTHLNTMSWAPFYHPSGDYLIFASSLYGHANFELMIVDREGTKAPVRVTDQTGFDGLPVFTPDGTELYWTHSNENGEAQIYRGRWDDAAARTSLGLPPRAPSRTSPRISAEDAKRWVTYLADPYFEGRGTGSAKEREYAQALANALTSYGLKTELKSYEFTSGWEIAPSSQFNFKNAQGATTLTLQQEWVPLSTSKVGRVPSAGLAFAGYGLVTPATAAGGALDAFNGLEVKDRWVVVFSGLPENVTNERRIQLYPFSSTQNKALQAARRGAVGLIVVELEPTARGALDTRYEGRSGDSGLPVVRLARGAGERLLKAANQDLGEWQRRLSSGEGQGRILDGVDATADIDLHFKKGEALNVIARLAAPGAKDAVIVGAHMDHLGHGEFGHSLAPTSNAPHVGADDNASGVAGVLELAQALATDLREKRVRLKHNLIFALWSGEEIGILGSSHFARTDREKIHASLNMDMIGRLREYVNVQGVGSAPEWKSLVEAAATRSGLRVQTQEDPYLPSDALTFYMKGAPSISLFTGSHADYHTPNDIADKLNFDGLSQIVELARDLTTAVVSQVNAVKYQKVEANHKDSPAKGMRLYLGTIPDYARELPRGVAITGTSKNSPAEKAGLQAGDILIELGGLPIRNLNDYVYCLQALKANEKTKLKLLRAGREQIVEITPQPKSY